MKKMTDKIEVMMTPKMKRNFDKAVEKNFANRSAVIRGMIQQYIDKNLKEEEKMRKMKVVIIEAGWDYTEKLETLELEVPIDDKAAVDFAIEHVTTMGYTVIPNDKGGQNEMANGYIAITVDSQELSFEEMVEKANDKITENDYVRLVDKARHMADEGPFTDDAKNWDENSQYLVADMADIVKAHFNELAVMEVFEVDLEDLYAVDGPEKWAELHRIKLLG